MLIETYPAAFEMEEILYELREHSAGLNAGRWDYMFSVIKCFRTRGKEFLLPGPQLGDDDGAVHARLHRAAGAHLPQARRPRASAGWRRSSRARTPEVNERAFEKVTEDKTREADDGFDGSWVAHPGMVDALREVFDKVLGDRPNQLEKTREDVHVTAAQLLDVASTPGEVTEEGLRSNISVGIQYLESWLRGSGAVGINNLMEDAATAEISRSQVWQWLHNDVELGRRSAGDPRAGGADDRGGDGQRSGTRSARRRSPSGAGTTRARRSPRWRWPTTTPTS